jgi:hypothetical protein
MMSIVVDDAVASVSAARMRSVFGAGTLRHHVVRLAGA